MAERKFGWSRDTVQKGLDEWETGEIIPDAPKQGCCGFFARLPNLQDDIRSLVDANTCTHQTFEKVSFSINVSLNHEKCRWK